MRLEHLGRCALAVAFLAYEASLQIDAMVRVFVRTLITRKLLLQWTSAAHAARGIASRSPHVLFWQSMRASPLLAVAIAVLVALTRSSALSVAAPLLLLWCAAPEIAHWVSAPLHSRAQQLGLSDRRKLRKLARRTWRFFDAFVGPNDQWLPVDNYQEEPREQTAHRTSPTNIGLMFLATLSAYDFGFIGLTELSLRVRMAFDSLARLSRYQGHLFNWYDTKSLQPLLPHYVSTVDSGNYAGCLVALKQGCLELATAPVVRRSSWEGLRDSVDLLEEVVEDVPKVAATRLLAVFARMQRTIEHGRDHADEAYATLGLLCDGISPELDRELLELLEGGAFRQQPDVLRALRTSIDRLRNQIHQMRRELDALLPWLGLADEIAARPLALPTTLRLDEIPAASRRLRAELDTWQRECAGGPGVTPEMAKSAHRLTEAFEQAEGNASHLKAELLALAALADEDSRGMDFRLLFDGERKLFRIGYNATVDQLDQHHYDLLASEARLASYLAIVDHAVQESHWYALGRPMTQLAGGPALLSWGGTMFEYLMPELLMRSREGTLLARTSDHVVDAQIAYAKRRNEPWGVSESAYARLDAGQTYQYRSFGVPGLGFKRGLEDDRVVTPYASILALAVRPGAVVENLAALQAMGMLGTYGLFEALDFSPDRALPDGEVATVVRSYMAHHQGMLLVALGNYLNQRSMVDRFHADARVQTGEVLLNEHAPTAVPPEWPLAGAADTSGPSPVTTQRAPEWSPAETLHPQAMVLSNGRMTTLLTDSGGGGLAWKGIALTRYDADSTRDDEGIWIYLRDRESGQVWRATSAQGRTTFTMHKAQLHRRGQGLSVHLDVAVAPASQRGQRGAPRSPRCRTGAQPSRLLQHVRGERGPSRAGRHSFQPPPAVARRRGSRPGPPAGARRRGRHLHRVRDRARRVLRPLLDLGDSRVAGGGTGVPAGSRGSGAGSGHEPLGQRGPETTWLGHPGLRHRGGTLAERGHRAGATLRIDAHGALDVRRRGARELATAAKNQARAGALAGGAAPPFRASLRRSGDARLRRGHRLGASVQASPLGSRDLRRRPHPAPSRARSGIAVGGRGTRGTALPSLLRRAPRPGAPRRATVGIRQRRAGHASPRAGER
jgi:cyclic beta-1,2-glucan synthetase